LTKIVVAASNDVLVLVMMVMMLVRVAVVPGMGVDESDVDAAEAAELGHGVTPLYIPCYATLVKRLVNCCDTKR
jgi:hypothetical protein